MLRKLTGDKGKVLLSSVDWSADGKYLCWISSSPATKRRDLVVWDVAKNAELLRQVISKDVSAGDGIAFSPDSRMIAAPAMTMTEQVIGPLPDGGVVLLWDISDLTKDGESKAESNDPAAEK
jgi:WD40 repeat protein